ncbi:unnamed protein product [Angiostrongylus costaricensis]|uniref:Uncharacterized protein n=1 Tax=Angiostrongylus costaricensis TaxID=334426 RepID=A0A0R3PVJ1_ANGCS|nr:unnamed protein product [Angiostrongylus costaricensis]
MPVQDFHDFHYLYTPASKPFFKKMKARQSGLMYTRDAAVSLLIAWMQSIVLNAFETVLAHMALLDPVFFHSSLRPLE